MTRVIEPKKSNYYSAETWYCESDAELTEIPESAPPGSIAEILTENGLTIKMKNSSGEWIEI